jgi:type IV secretory pathway TrbF-like protein
MLWRFALIALLTCLLVSLILMGSLVWEHKQANAIHSYHSRDSK